MYVYVFTDCCLPGFVFCCFLYVIVFLVAVDSQCDASLCIIGSTYLLNWLLIGCVFLLKFVVFDLFAQIQCKLVQLCKSNLAYTCDMHVHVHVYNVSVTTLTCDLQLHNIDKLFPINCSIYNPL